MKEIRITNIVKLFIILLLYEKQRYGYEIIREVSKKIGKKVGSEQIYPFLKKLTQSKYVTFKESGFHEKKIYRLTPAGKAFVRKHLNRFGSLIEIAIEPQIKVCTHCGCRVISGGYIEMYKNKKLIFCCAHCAKSYFKEKHEGPASKK